MKTEIFSFKRFALLLNRQKVLMAKTWLIAMISVISFVFLVALLQLIFTQGYNWYNTLFSYGFFSFFVMGCVFASMAFSEMGTYAKSFQYICLPASPLEKFLSAWFISFVVFIIAAILLLTVASLILALISVMLFSQEFVFFNLLAQNYSANLLLLFFGYHSIYFLGAVWFKKAAFFKTLLTSIVWGFIIIISFVFLFIIIVKPFSLLADPNVHVSDSLFANIGEDMRFFNSSIPLIMQSVFLLFIAWIRFNEREA